MKNRLLALLVMSMAVLAFSVNAFAATGLSDGEQSLLDYASKKAGQYGVSETFLFKSYYDEVSRYLAANDEDLSDETVKTMLATAEIEAAKIEKVLDEYGTTSLVVLHKEYPQVWEDLWNEVRNDVTPGVLEFGVIVSADVKAHLFTLSDKDGNAITTGGDPIKWTGAGMAPVAAGITVMAAVLAACAFVAYKKGLFSSKEA